MVKHDVTLDQVMTATSDALDAGLLPYSQGTSSDAAAGSRAPSSTGVRHVLPIVTSEDMATIPIAVRNGRQVELQDVADLVRDHQPLIGDAVINQGDGLMLIVEKLPWANTMDVTRGVEEALAELSRDSGASRWTRRSSGRRRSSRTPSTTSPRRCSSVHC